MTLMKSAPPIVAPEALAKIVSTYRSVQEGVPTRCQFMSALGQKGHVGGNHGFTQ